MDQVEQVPDDGDSILSSLAGSVVYMGNIHMEGRPGLPSPAHTRSAGNSRSIAM